MGNATYLRNLAIANMPDTLTDRATGETFSTQPPTTQRAAETPEAQKAQDLPSQVQSISKGSGARGPVNEAGLGTNTKLRKTLLGE